MQLALKDLADTGRVAVEPRGNAVLKFALPIDQPDLHRVLKSEAAGRRAKAADGLMVEGNISHIDLLSGIRHCARKRG